MTSNKVLLALTLFANLVRPDDFVEELRHRCNLTKKSYACTKFKLFDLMDQEGLQPQTSPRALGGFVRLVKINGESNDLGLFPEARYYGGDTELMKMIKFIQRKAARFLESQGMSFALPEGVIVVDEDTNSIDVSEGRRKKGGTKKKEMLIPLIMLFKLFKIKVLVSLVLLSVLFIKKTILLTAIFLPSVIQSIKNHCKTSYHVVPHHIEDEHLDHDVSGAGWGYTGYGHGNDMERRRLQRAHYKPVYIGR